MPKIRAPFSAPVKARILTPRSEEEPEGGSGIHPGSNTNPGSGTGSSNDVSLGSDTGSVAGLGSGSGSDSDSGSGSDTGSGVGSSSASGSDTDSASGSDDGSGVGSGSDDGSDTDFSVQISDAQSKGAELVFLPMYYTPASLIFAQAKAAGYSPIWFGVDGMDGILTLEGFDTALAEGVMLLTPFNADSDDAHTQAFVKSYQAKYGDVPNQFAADAYDCVYAYKQALELANCTADMSAEDICASMIAQFTSMTFDGLTGEGMAWGTDGAVTKSPKGMVIQNGSYVGLD